MPQRRLISLFLACASTASVAPAWAEAPNAKNAEALFRSARDAMAHGDLATACARFAESQRLEPAPGTLLNLAQCEEKQGHLTSSQSHLKEALESLPSGDPRLAYAKKRMGELESRIPSVRITLLDDADASVTQDGIALTRASLGDPLKLDPGSHEFVVRSAGHDDARQTVSLREGDHISLALKPGPAHAPRPLVAPPPAAPRAEGPVTPGPPATVDGTRRAYGAGAFALGAVGMVTGVVTGLLVAEDAGVYREHCDATGCDAEGLAASSRSRTLEIVSPVAFGVGAIGLGVGAYLWLTSKRSASPRTGVDLRPQLAPGAAALSVGARF